MSSEWRKMKYVRRIARPYTCDFNSECAKDGFGISFYSDENEKGEKFVHVKEPGQFHKVGIVKDMKVLAINQIPTYGWTPQELECIVKACERSNCFEQESLTLWIYDLSYRYWFCGQCITEGCVIS